MTALVIAASADGRLLDATRRLVAAARRLDTEVHLVVIDTPAGPLAAQAAQIDGVARVLALGSDAPDLAAFDAIAAAIEPLAGNCGSIVAADSGRGRYVLPLLAARLGVAPLTSVSGIRDDGSLERLLHAGSINEQLRFDAPVRLITVRAAAFPAAGAAPAPCPIEPAGNLASGAVTITDRAPPATAGPQLETARLVLAGGRGLGSAETFHALERLAAKLGAALGASRVAVDMGWAPHELQIGQTGRRIAPALYVAIGISGAAQHLAGIREAERVIAINKDAAAPIFRHADLGITADAGPLIAELLARLGGDD
jgi:electron transfer flavoprotein alpha subunit